MLISFEASTLRRSADGRSSMRAPSRCRSKPPDQVEPVHHLHGRNPAAQAYSRNFGLGSTDGGTYQGAWGQGQLHTGADDFSKCSKLWVTSGKLWDTDADGSGAIAWLAYTDCASGERQYFKLGSVAGEGKSTNLTTTPVYNAKHPTVMVCTYKGSSQMRDCGSSW
ncbi:hypothetical protein [Streptomyces sp. NPDC087300]|uniref:hypothetical protein n=1 Tax=Streptomyces sp. NPDC087300 TaxID=3365780 RepID=UPI00382979B7